MLADETMLRPDSCGRFLHAQPANYGHSTALSRRHSNVGFFLKVLLEGAIATAPV
jgi:hypothetical protein